MCPKAKISSPSTYRVRTGLIDLTIEAASPAAAIAVAREQLCLELPRLWDLIQTLPDARFDVEVTGAPEATRPNRANEFSEKNEAA